MFIKTGVNLNNLFAGRRLKSKINMPNSKEQMKKQLYRFRMVGIAEGISFLVLLLIAMPLKYVFKIPEAVKFTGWVHGALFVTYIWFAFEVFGSFKKSFLWLLKAVIVAFLPFGTILFDKELKKDAALLEQPVQV